MKTITQLAAIAAFFISSIGMAALVNINSARAEEIAERIGIITHLSTGDQR